MAKNENKSTSGTRSVTVVTGEKKGVDKVSWQSVALVGLFIVFLGFVVWTFFGQPTHVEVGCEFANWEELPENLTWFGDMEMYPMYAKCNVVGEGNIFKWMMQIEGE